MISEFSNNVCQTEITMNERFIAHTDLYLTIYNGSCEPWLNVRGRVIPRLAKINRVGFDGC